MGMEEEATRCGNGGVSYWYGNGGRSYLVCEWKSKLSGMGMEEKATRCGNG